MHDKFRQEKVHKVHQTKCVREHFVSKHKDELVGFVFVLSICLQCHSSPSDGNVKQHSRTGITLHSWNPGHFPCTHYTVLQGLLIFCLGAKQKSQARWKSVCSGLLLKLSELLSWIRNHWKNKICSRPQICHSSLRHEKEKLEITNIQGTFHGGKYILLDTLVTISLNYFHFSSEVFFCVS